MTWAMVLNAVLGAWFIASPFVLHFNNQRIPMELSILGGAILLLRSLWQLAGRSGRRRTGIDYVNSVVGLWFIGFPFVFKLRPVPNLMRTSIVGGVLTLLLSAYLAPDAGSHSGTGATEAHG